MILVLIFLRVQEEKLWEEQYFSLLKISEENDWFKSLQLPTTHSLIRPSGEGLVHSSTSNLLSLRLSEKYSQKMANFVSLTARIIPRTRCFQEWTFAGKQKEHKVQPGYWANVDDWLCFVKPEKSAPAHVVTIQQRKQSSCMKKWMSSPFIYINA